MDDIFFKHAMHMASIFFDREAGDMVHKLLLTGDNYNFITSAGIVWFLQFKYLY